MITARFATRGMSRSTSSHGLAASSPLRLRQSSPRRYRTGSPIASPRRPGLGIPRASGETRRHLRHRAAGSILRRVRAIRRAAARELRSDGWANQLRHHSSDAAQTGQPRAQLSDARSSPCSLSSASLIRQQIPLPMHLAAWRGGSAYNGTPHPFPSLPPPGLST